jgi:hypothetical protein
MQSHAAVVGDRCERDALDAAGTEQLRNGQRPLGEVAPGRQQLDLHTVAGERLQGEHVSRPATPAPATSTRVGPE